MTPVRVDRQSVRSRLDDVPGWIVEALLDDFEPAALAAQAAARKKRAGGKPGPDTEADDD